MTFFCLYYFSAVQNSFILINITVIFAVPGAMFVTNEKGKYILVMDGCKYRSNGGVGAKTRWRCTTHAKFSCKAAVHIYNNEVVYYKNDHTTSMEPN
jgi:hypothetical protein